MKIVPLSIAHANMLVAKWHRHHKPLRVAKFAIGCESDGVLVGAAICFRPASRALDDGRTLEVSRLVTDGTENACSKLYGACAEIAKAMGFSKIQTYILDTEPGTSLRGSGWSLEASGCGGSPQGMRTNRPNGHELSLINLMTKQRWVKVFAP
jgi:hypothetical protein